MKAKPIFLIPFLLIIMSCIRVENKIVTYTSKVPFSTEFDRSIEFEILNDSAFLIHTLYLTPGFVTDCYVSLTISSGTIYKMDNYFYAKDDLSGEIILFSKDGNYLHSYSSRYDNLSFKLEMDDIDESDITYEKENYYRKKDYFMEEAKQLNLYRDKIKDLNSTMNNNITFSNDSTVEFSNPFGLNLFLFSDSTYLYTIENLLFSAGDWQFEKGRMIFTESVTFKNSNYPYEIPDKILNFIEKSENIYTTWLVNDSTLLMGTLPFAQSCQKMTRVQPDIKCKFFTSLIRTPYSPKVIK